MIEVNVSSFSGPMDLLLELLKNDKLDIYEIEIAKITEQFLSVMQQMEISSEDLSDFIRMASILVLMKARMLLSDQEEEEEIPTREQLITQLLRYRQFKEIALQLRDLEGRGAHYFTKLPEELERYAKVEWVPLSGDPGRLAQTLEGIFARRQPHAFEVENIVNVEEYSLQSMQSLIREKLQAKQSFTFIDLFKDGRHTRARAIVLFLSLLELVRTEEIHLQQKEEEIIIRVPKEKQEVDYDATKL